MILDVGCGAQKEAGAVGIDRLNLSGVDAIHDLDTYPYPFPENHFEKIVSYNVLEHLTDPLTVLVELHRIAKPGVVIHVEVPHFSSCDSFTDPTHRHFFSSRSFDYLDSSTELYKLSYFNKPYFKIVSRHLTFWGSNRLIDGSLEWLFNKIILFYERKLAFIFPAHQLFFDLEVVK